MDNSLFISYSHVDAAWMQTFKKHLRGILMERCEVWTDQDIPAGSTWQDKLLGSLRQASAGLVLVSPDYLVSPWCRRELDAMNEAFNNGRLFGVYWVLLRPCGWKWSPLSSLQAIQDPADRALLSVADGPEREAQVVFCCDRIVSTLGSHLKVGDPVLASIRTILLRSKKHGLIKPLEKLAKGDFSIACRALDSNGKDIVVKVLTHTPLDRLRKVFLKIGEACRDQIRMPSVIRTIDVFVDGEETEERVVILSETADGRRLSEVMTEDRGRPPAERLLTADNIGVALRRLAEGLEALHAMPAIETEMGSEPYRHLMGPLLPRKVYYDPATKRPQVSPVGVTNFLWKFFEPQMFRQIVAPQTGTYLLPEKVRGDKVDVFADQYFLGMLALEMLEGKELFIVAGNEQPVDPLEVLARAQWARRHEQLRNIIARLLAKDPLERFENMTKVASSFRRLEGESRALAKYSFGRYVTGEEFSKDFYTRLFAGSPQVRDFFASAQKQRMKLEVHDVPLIPDEAHQRKLLDALKAVLNFRVGGQPSSIDSVALRHVEFKLTKEYLQDFEDSFVATLEDYVTRTDEGRAEVVEIVKAWRDLFRPVKAEMLRVRE